MNKTIHQVGEMVGITSRETDQILVQVRDNTAKLEGCSGPHDFSIALDRHTKQPIPIPNPTPAQTLGCKWQCSKCGGYVDAIDKSWHNRGLASAMKETGKLIDELAEANRKLGKFIRLIEFAQSADDAQTEREIAASATFREALAYTNSEVLEYEVEELRTANTKLKSENESLRNEGLETVRVEPNSPTWPHVLHFAKRMEAKLAKNRHKGTRENWLKDHPWDLVERILDETVEVQQCFTDSGNGPQFDDAEKLANECADVANFCMMVADSAANFKNTKP